MMGIDADKQREKIDRLMTNMAKEQAKLLLVERAEQRKKAKAEAEARRRERAALFRSADAHRKIVLGGLTIAAGVDEWDPAEIVGALLVMADHLAREPNKREALRQKGIEHLEAREAARRADRQ